jgi:hypothetical protein
MVNPPKGYGSRTRPPATTLGGSTPQVNAFPMPGGEMSLSQTRFDEGNKHLIQGMAPGGVGNIDKGFDTEGYPLSPAFYGQRESLVRALTGGPADGTFHGTPMYTPRIPGHNFQTTVGAPPQGGAHNQFAYAGGVAGGPGAGGMAPPQAVPLTQPIQRAQSPAGPGNYATPNSPPQMPYQPQMFPAQPAAMPQAAPGKAESPYRSPSAAPGTSVTGGYVYDSDTPVGMNPHTQAWVQRQMESNKTAGSGPYDNAYGRFESLPSTPQPNDRPLTPPPAGTVMEGGTNITQLPDGRTVGLGPDRRNGYAYENAEPGTDAYKSNQAGKRGRSGVHVNTSGNDAGHNYTPEQLEANRDRSIANSQQKKEAYKTGRRDRAIKKYGLDHLTPSYAQAPADAQRYSGSESGNTSVSLNPTAAGTDNRNVVQKGQDLSDAMAHPIFADKDKVGFKPESAGINDMQGYYRQHSTKWNAKDKEAFKNYIHQRKTNDPDKFGKEWDAYAAQTEYVMPPEDAMATPEVRMQHFEENNAFRAEMGLPPLSLRKPGNKTVQSSAF